jgi:hypothetical protein
MELPPAAPPDTTPRPSGRALCPPELPHPPEGPAAVHVHDRPAAPQLGERDIRPASQADVGEQAAVAIEGVLRRVGPQLRPPAGGQPPEVGGCPTSAALDAAKNLRGVDAEESNPVTPAARALERAHVDGVAVDDPRDAHTDRLGAPARSGGRSRRAASATGAGQRGARDPVTIGVQAVGIAPRPTALDEVALRLRLVFEVRAVAIRGRSCRRPSVRDPPRARVPRPGPAVSTGPSSARSKDALARTRKEEPVARAVAAPKPPLPRGATDAEPPVDPAVAKHSHFDRGVRHREEHPDAAAPSHRPDLLTARVRFREDGAGDGASKGLRAGPADDVAARRLEERSRSRGRSNHGDRQGAHGQLAAQPSSTEHRWPAA